MTTYFYKDVTQRRNMQWFSRSVLMLFLSSSSIVYAHISPEAGKWGIQGEYLYLHPTINQTAYVSQETATAQASGSRTHNRLDGYSAYRVEGVYNFCNCWNDFRFLWTQLPRCHHTSSISDPNGLLSPTQDTNFLAPGVSFFNNASSKIFLDYHAADALVGFGCFQNRCIHILLQLGVQYARIHFDEKLTFTNPTNLITYRNMSEIWGIGPEAALQVGYALPFCWNFFGIPSVLSVEGSARGALLATRYDTQLDVFFNLGVPITSLNIKDRHWDFAPFFDIRLGLNYALTFQCLCAYLEVGYEILSYQNAVNRITFEGTANANSFDLYSDVSFRGPYASLGFSF